MIINNHPANLQVQITQSPITKPNRSIAKSLNANSHVLNYLATRFTCSWPWSIAVMLCDGRIVCGCADPYAKRVLGDFRTTPLSEIWRGLTGDRAARGSESRRLDLCGDCPLKRPLAADQTAPVRDLGVSALPSRLYIECTAACNISCFQACCAPETGITRTRQAGMLDWNVFTRVVDEAGPSPVRIDFFNYGEAFLHKRAVEMCEHQDEVSSHLSLHEHQRPGLQRSTSAAPGAFRHRRSHLFDRWRVAANARAIPPTRKV